MSHPKIPETRQPLYVICDASHHMDSARLFTANLILGYLAAGITSAPELATAISLCIQEFSGGSSTTLKTLAPLDPVVPVPQLTATLDEPSLATAFAGVRAVIAPDLAQLDADGFHVRQPVIVLITSGYSTDEEADRRREFTDLVAGNLWPDPAVEWKPAIFVFAVDVPKVDVITGLMESTEDSTVYPLRAGADPQAKVDDLIGFLDLSVRSGTSGLRISRWVLSVGKLGTLVPTGQTADVILHETPDLSLPNPRGPLTYLQFRNTEDADAHPFDDLLDLVSLWDKPSLRAQGDHITDRACWPARVVVTDDAPSVAIGLVAPAVPAKFVDDDGTMHAPRTVHNLYLDTTVTPLVPENVPAPADADTRAQICLHMASTIDVAHGNGITLGPETLDSALYSLKPEPDVLLSQCDGARISDSTDPQWQQEDLRWLARFIERCVDESLLPPAVAGAANVPVVLDDNGRRMLAGAKSNVGAATPSAERWRDYLAQRVLELRGPPVVTAVQVSPPITVAGGEVTVRWRSRYAESVTVIGPDGSRFPVPSKDVDDGALRLVVATAGQVRVLATNPIGGNHLDSAWIHVFDPPTISHIKFPAAPTIQPDWYARELDGLIAGAWGMNDGNPNEALASAHGVLGSGSGSGSGSGTADGGARRSARRAGGAGELAKVIERSVFPIDIAGWYARPQDTPRRKRSRKWKLPWG